MPSSELILPITSKGPHSTGPVGGTTIVSTTVPTSTSTSASATAGIIKSPQKNTKTRTVGRQYDKGNANQYQKLAGECNKAFWSNVWNIA